MIERLSYPFSRFRYTTESKLTVDTGRNLFWKKPVKKITRQINEQIAAEQDLVVKGRLTLEAEKVIGDLTVQSYIRTVVEAYMSMLPTTAILIATDLPTPVGFSLVALATMRVAREALRAGAFHRAEGRLIKQGDEIQDTGLIIGPILPFKRERIKRQKSGRGFVSVEAPAIAK